MLTVSLNGIEFFAYHGFYAEEQLIGGKYIIDLSVAFEPLDDLAADDLDRTVNYEVLYNICREEMANPRKLIETVADAIIQQIKTSYTFAELIEITLKKMHPPLHGPVNHSAVHILYRKPVN